MERLHPCTSLIFYISTLHPQQRGDLYLLYLAATTNNRRPNSLVVRTLPFTGVLPVWCGTDSDRRGRPARSESLDRDVGSTPALGITLLLNSHLSSAFACSEGPRDMAKSSAYHALYGSLPPLHNHVLKPHSLSLMSSFISQAPPSSSSI